LSIQEWKKKKSTELRLRYILDAYWEAAIKRELVNPQMELKGWRSRTYKKKVPPNPMQTRKWLVYLSQQLQRQSQTEFSIEKIQPWWLPKRYNKLIYALGVGLFFGLIVGLITATIIFVIIFHFINIFIGLISGLILGIFVALFSAIWAFFTIGQSPEIEPVETLNMSWLNLGKSLIVGFLIGIISWLITLIAFPLFNWQPPELVFFMFIGPVLVSILEMRGSPLEITKQPNQGIWHSFNNAICFAILGGVWLGLSAFLVREKIFFLIVSLVFNKSAISASPILSLPHTGVIVLSGILAGIFFGLTEAGTACIQHFTLRFILYRNGYIPWNYARFLDYCTERLFLQRVGGRYRFIHRLLHEHFAAMPLKQ
jgi:MFS family permease